MIRGTGSSLDAEDGEEVVVVVEIASGVKIRVLKTSVQGKVALPDETAPKGDEAAKREEK